MLLPTLGRALVLLAGAALRHPRGRRGAPAREGLGRVGPGGPGLADDGDPSGGRQPPASPRLRDPRRRLPGAAGPAGGLRPLRALAALPAPRGGRARAAARRPDVVGLLAHRPAGERLLRGLGRPAGRPRLQHDAAVDVEDEGAGGLSRGPGPGDLDLHAGERAAGPERRRARRLLRPPRVLVRARRLHRRAGPGAPLRPPLPDRVLGGPQRAGPRAQAERAAVHADLRRGRRCRARRLPRDEVRGRLARLPPAGPRVLRALPRGEEPRAGDPARHDLVPLLRVALARPVARDAGLHRLRGGRGLPDRRAVHRADPRAGCRPRRAPW